jgi:hypothetical protein
MNVGLMFSFRNPPKWKKPWADVYESQRLLAGCASVRSCSCCRFTTPCESPKTQRPWT